MPNISVNFSKDLGPVKPMHGVGQPPLSGLSTNYFHYLSEASIPYSRLHDVGGWFGGNMFVDIPNIFRDFDADEQDPNSYDFAFTDILISGLVKHNCMPVYRLGVTIENFHQIKAYRIYPPKDFGKWARICEHVIRHYNEGWANGFHYNIQYWEIWNEPDSSVIIGDNPMWKGTPEEFFELYRVASLHLRKCFGDTIKIGGYGSCGFYGIYDAAADGAVAEGKLSMPESEMLALINRRKGYVKFFDRFIQIVKEQDLPFDFFTYHSYANAADTMKMQMYVEEKLHACGLDSTEIHLNEWNPCASTQEKGTGKAAANIAAMMCAMQNARMDMMCYYDARISTSTYAGLFNPMTFKPLPAYYALKAFGNLYLMRTQVEATCDGEGVYVVAAAKGGDRGVLVTNIGKDTQITTNLDPNMTAWLIDDTHYMEPVDLDPQNFLLKSNATLYFA